MFSKTFKDLSKSDVGIAGGKGASLGEMYNVGISVPDGFVVLSGTFDYFIENSNLSGKIEEILSSVDIDKVQTVESASETIRELILGIQIPEKIINEIESQFKDLGSKYVAVRSSATAEDGVEHAWAGQLSSYLNVTEESLIDSVKKCWASLFTARAIVYRVERKLDSTGVSVAVVIQKMVDADKSGVAFSVHPITEDEDQMIIEAGFGLGEAIVSGAVTPDSYVFSKSENEAIDIKINNQKQALYRSQKSEDGEFNEWVTLEVKKAISQVLSDLEIQVLASDILNIEKHYGFPCDIEWAKEGDRFYITQSRPITTISRSKKDDPVKWKKVWEAGNAPVFEMTHGTVLAYSDMKELGLVDFDLQIVGSKKKISAFHSEEGLMKSAARGYRYFLSEKGDEFLMESRKLIDLSYGFIDGTDFKYQAGELDTFKETSNLIRKVFAFFNLTNPQFLSKLEQEVLFEIKSTAGLDSGGIFRDLCVSEKISSLQSEQAAWMNLVSSVSEEKFHEKEIEVLISDHHQAFGSLVGDEGNSAWDEQYFKRLLEKDLKSEINYKNEIEAINQYSDDILKLKRNHVEVHGLSSDLVSRTELLSDLGHVRLELRSAWTALFHKLREVLKDISDVHGISQDILLDYNADEIIEFLEKRAELVKKPDEFSVGFVNDEWDVGFGGNAVKQESIYVGNTKSLENGELVGSTAFPGFVTGKAVVLDWGSDDFEEKITNFPKDGILVAGQTRPMLVPAIRIASAIVTDEGGITSHAAIVAREFKKPCVIGTVLATESIKDGDTIEVDADNGLVRIIKIKKPSVVSEDL